MKKGLEELQRARKSTPFTFVATLALTVAVLYWGRPVLMPLALAVLLTFLLLPVVNFVHRLGIGRKVGVIVVVLLLFSTAMGGLFVLGREFTALANELPLYRENIRAKVADLRTAGKDSAVEKLQKTVQEVIGEIEQAEEQENPVPETVNAEERPVPVIVTEDRPSRRLIPPQLGPLAEVLATFGLVIVLVIFMLLRHLDLRNRLIRLVGLSRLTTTTKALDEAGGRISRYLLMQSSINALYGTAVAAALYFIGVPYVLLWGVLAFLARFIPYVGPWVGALAPIALSLAVFDGWFHPVLVMAVIICLELLTNMVLEPLLYGQSAGVSEVALLVAIAFWTWVWGPIGLALATPLTVCFVVLCKYIPQLEFIEVLMGDEPVANTELVFYQRLLAADRGEATEIVRKFLAVNPVERLFDSMLIPAVSFAKRDVERGNLGPDDQLFIVETLREVVNELNVGELAAAPGGQGEHAEATGQARVRVLGCPAYDEFDETVLLMLAKVMDPRLFDFEVLSFRSLSSEVTARASSIKPDILIVSSVPPGAMPSARYLCKRLRHASPSAKIVCGRWALRGNIQETREQLKRSGADLVPTTFIEARNQLIQLAQLARPDEAEQAPETRRTAGAVPA